MYNNVRDYSTGSFYTGLLSVRYSPSLLLLTLGIMVWNTACITKIVAVV